MGLSGVATNILLTGVPGVGKTTTVRRTLGLLSGMRLGGFVTQAIEERGKRTGFSITDLNGPSGVLASSTLTFGPRVGRYRVNVSDLERIGVPALLDALSSADLIVCDEIGRMELFCPAFCEAVVRCLESPKPALGTIQARYNDFLDAIRARADVALMSVTPANRDRIPEEVARAIMGIVSRRADELSAPFGEEGRDDRATGSRHAGAASRSGVDGGDGHVV